MNPSLHALDEFLDKVGLERRGSFSHRALPVAAAAGVGALAGAAITYFFLAPRTQQLRESLRERVSRRLHPEPVRADAVPPLTPTAARPTVHS
jgi:hypothetical protein